MDSAPAGLIVGDGGDLWIHIDRFPDRGVKNAPFDHHDSAWQEMTSVCSPRLGPALTDTIALSIARRERDALILRFD